MVIPAGCERVVPNNGKGDIYNSQQIARDRGFMTLQQMRYLLAVAEYGSITAAAQQLFIAQSSLSLAVQEAERETGVTIFKRSNRGVEVTPEGYELLSFVRQVVQQDDLLNSRFIRNGEESVSRFAVSSQHYSLGVDAFAELLQEYPDQVYSFAYRETQTLEVIEDLKSGRSQVGLLYLSTFNSRVIKRELDAASLEFTPLFTTKPRVLVSESHPLAGRRYVDEKVLASYPRFIFEQGKSGSLYYAEEPLNGIPSRSQVTVCDRSTMVCLLAKSDGYTIATGVHSTGTDHGITSLALHTNETMTVGYVVDSQHHLSREALRYIELLKEQAELAYGAR